MNRRNWLKAVLAGAVLDPERLLWRPGQRLISIPAPINTYLFEKIGIRDSVSSAGFWAEQVIVHAPSLVGARLELAAFLTRVPYRLVSPDVAGIIPVFSVPGKRQ